MTRFISSRQGILNPETRISLGVVLGRELWQIAYYICRGYAAREYDTWEVLVSKDGSLNLRVPKIITETLDRMARAAGGKRSRSDVAREILEGGLREDVMLQQSKDVWALKEAEAESVLRLCQRWRSGNTWFTAPEFEFLSYVFHHTLLLLPQGQEVRKAPVAAALLAFAALYRETNAINREEEHQANYYLGNLGIDRDGTPDLVAEREANSLPARVPGGLAELLTRNLEVFLRDSRLPMDVVNRCMQPYLPQLLGTAIAGQSNGRDLFRDAFMGSRQYGQRVRSRDRELVDVEPVNVDGATAEIHEDADRDIYGAVRFPNGNDVTLTFSTAEGLDDLEDFFEYASNREDHSGYTRLRGPVCVQGHTDEVVFLSTLGMAVYIPRKEFACAAQAFTELLSHPKIKQRREGLFWVYGRI